MPAEPRFPPRPTEDELERRIDLALQYLHPYLDTGDSRTAPDWAVALAGILTGATIPFPVAKQDPLVRPVTNDEPLPQ